MTQILLATLRCVEIAGIAFGLSVMTLIINCSIGHHGKNDSSGDLKLAKLYSKKLQKLFVFMGIICGVLLFFIRIPVLSLYQLSPETREMANTFLIILSVVMVGMSYQMPTNGGIIRGSGSIAYSMKVDLISTWRL